MLRNLTIYKIVPSQTSEPNLDVIHIFPQKLLKITCQLKNGVKDPHIQAVINRKCDVTSTPRFSAISILAYVSFMLLSWTTLDKIVHGYYININTCNCVAFTLI